MAAQLDHERLSAFLFRLIGDFVEQTQRGMMLGSRTAVRIGQFRGRLPDLLFVRQENLSRMEQMGLRFAPDLVIEIVSPGDRLSDIVGLKTDYRNIRVPEVLFVDQRKQTVTVLRLQAGESDEAEYDEQTLGLGESITLDSLGGVALPLEWLFTEPRPTVQAALALWQTPLAGS